jgi:YVTN family beta-propeller protein
MISIAGRRLVPLFLIAGLASCAGVGTSPSESGSEASTSPTTSQGASPSANALPPGVLALVTPSFLPSGLLFAEGSLWAEDHASTNKFYRLDPASAEVTGVIDLERPCDAAAGFGNIWLADSDRGALLRIDPESLEIVATIEGLSRPCGPQVVGDGVWIAVDQGIAKIDPASNTTAFTVGEGGTFPAAGGPPLWGAEFGTGKLLQIDTLDGRISATATLSGNPEIPWLLVADGQLWATNDATSEVKRFDANSGTETGTISVSLPSRLALVEDVLWVTSYEGGSVYAIDTSTLEVLETLALGGTPNGIAIVPAGVWVADTTGRLFLLDLDVR